ncbi:MAG: MFS transporter [Spirochaetales bacterium]|nr:MFS transporter [Spirochaetales bacterium]
MIIEKLIRRLRGINPDIFLFAGALLFVGFSQGTVDSTFNNFLKESFGINSLERSVIELPRELPGFLVAFVSAFLFLLGPRRTAAVANLLAAAGIFCIGLFSINFPVMLVWLFIFSMGQHIFLPLNSSLGIDLAREGGHGRRLGQFGGVQNLAYIGGSLLILLGFGALHFTFRGSYFIAAGGYLLAAVMLFLMKPDKPVPGRLRLRLKKEYSLFYWLNILYGTRKQIFLTFAPWVLVFEFRQNVQTVAFLLVVAGAIGILFRPILGRLIDRLGERFILAGEGAILVFVCLGYGLTKSLFGPGVGLVVACVCYIMDSLLMSVTMARATYLRKIARSPEEVAPALSMATTIDHAFSISIALLGGVLWSFFGYQAVFLMGAAIAAVNFFSALRIRLPAHGLRPGAAGTPAGGES